MIRPAFVRDAVLIMLATLASSAAATEAASQPAVVTLPPLRVGASVDREIGKTVTLASRLVIRPMQFAQIVIEVDGVEASARLSSPAGRTVAQAGHLNGFAREPLYVVARSDGRLTLSITAHAVRSSAGRLTIRLVEMRATAAADIARVDAQRAYSRGWGLLNAASPNLELARQAFARAARSWHEAGEATWEAQARMALASVHDQGGNFAEAVTEGEQARVLYQASGDRRGEAAALNELGWYHYQRSDKASELEAQNQAMALWRQSGDERGEAVTEYHLGRYYDHVDMAGEALEHYQRSLRYFAGTGEIDGQSTVHDYLGHHYNTFGEQQKAVEHFTQALKFAHLQHNVSSEAYTRHNLGMIYNTLGEYDLARAQFARSLAQSRLVGDRDLEAHATLNLGSTYTNLGQRRTALTYLERARRSLAALGDRNGEAGALNNLAKLYREIGRNADAFDSLTAANRIFAELKYTRGEMISVAGLGRLLCEAGRFDECFGRLNEAIAMSRILKDRNQEAVALSLIARYEAARGQLPQALGRIDEAERRIEGMRREIARDDLRASYFAVARPVYEQKVDILVRLDAREPDGAWQVAALETSERARARALLDAVPALTATAAARVPGPLLARRDELLEKLRKEGDGTTDLARELLADYYDTQAQIRAADPRYAELVEPAVPTVAEVRAALGPQAVAVEYLLGETHSHVWALKLQRSDPCPAALASPN